MAEVRPRSITKNAVFLAFASSTNILFQLAWVALVSRGLGDAGLGRYSFGLAVTQTLGILSDFGLNLFLTREVAGDKSKASVLLGSSIFVKTAASGLVWMLLLIFINHPQVSGYRTGILWMAAANYLQALGLSFSSVMRAFERMEYEAGASLLFNLLNLSFCFLALRQGGQAESLAMVYALTAACQLAVLAWVYRRKFGGLAWKPEPGFIKLWLNSVI
ncbi:MAG: oligosaccharide flippase family protein, partial [bacterium]|nr:oligosaccharide flippase family protein [bacterium]